MHWSDYLDWLVGHRAQTGWCRWQHRQWLGKLMQKSWCSGLVVDMSTNIPMWDRSPKWYVLFRGVPEPSAGTRQFHSNCASVCFELQLGCCYGAISLYNIKETAIAPRRSIWSLMSRLEHRRWLGKRSFPNLCYWFWCLAWSIGKTRCFLVCQIFCCDMIVVSILLNPHHGTAGWFGRCKCLYCCHISLVKSKCFWEICNLWNTEVDFRLFSRQRHTISRTFEVSESESDFAHFGSEGRGWVMHIDTLILKAYWSGYGMNEDFPLKLPIEESENL